MQAYHCSLAPIRAIRGGVIATGRSHDTPELVVSTCSAFVLKTKEFELLYLLASNPGFVFTRKRLLDSVWGDSVSVTARSVDNVVKHLRYKIEEDPPSPRLVLTVWKYGYKFADA